MMELGALKKSSSKRLGEGMYWLEDQVLDERG